MILSSSLKKVSGQILYKGPVGPKNGAKDINFISITGIGNFDHFRARIYKMIKTAMEKHVGQGSNVTSAISQATQMLLEKEQLRCRFFNPRDFVQFLGP